MIIICKGHSKVEFMYTIHIRVQELKDNTEREAANTLSCVKK
jgi:hypothetical protein